LPEDLHTRLWQKVSEIAEEGCAHKLGHEKRIEKLENRFFWIMALLIGNLIGVIINLIKP
jgi:hypothetical protein